MNKRISSVAIMILLLIKYLYSWIMVINCYCGLMG